MVPDWQTEFKAALAAVDGDVDKLTVNAVNAALRGFTDDWGRGQFHEEGLSLLFGTAVVVKEVEVADDYEDYSGPRQVLYWIGSRIFCKDARNISHVGWDWNEWEPVRVVTPRSEVRVVYE